MPLDQPCSFVCNICGQHVDSALSALPREKASCPHCRSSVRTRGVVYALTHSLYGVERDLSGCVADKSITGIGLSDWAEYARRLELLFNYRNTFYHKTPFLDITNPPTESYESCDFLISSEVFEHVPPPVDRAFRGAYSILKPGGALILTVPFGNSAATIEHFPDLNDFKIIELGGERCLINKTIDGKLQTFRNLKFHGGSGETLEMRRFCRSDLIRYLEMAGFEDIFILEGDALDFGIYHPNPWSLPIVARRPK